MFGKLAFIALCAVVAVTAESYDRAHKYDAEPDTRNVKHMATIYLKGNYICSGSLISDEWVLTSGFCTWGNTIPLEVALGSVTDDLAREDPNRQVFNATVYYAHHRFNSMFGNNIGLVKLDEKVVSNEFIAPAQLPNRGEIAGVDFYTKYYTAIFYKAELYWGTSYTIGKFDCMKYHDEWITGDILCTDFQAVDPQTVLPCDHEELGTGLISSENKVYGVLGHAGCDFEPNAWVRVETHLSWINEKTGL